MPQNDRKMKVTELKKILKEVSKEDLTKEIIDLFKKNDFVKDYYISKYGEDDGLSLLIKHKNIIENEFFPKKGDGKGRLSVAKKAITEFKKLSNNKQQIAELMLFYVETGVNYTNSYGDIDESFYFSMESMYEKVVNFIEANNLKKQFKDRCLRVVHETESMGWGFHDQLCEIYYGYYDE